MTRRASRLGRAGLVVWVLALLLIGTMAVVPLPLDLAWIAGLLLLLVAVSVVACVVTIVGFRRFMSHPLAFIGCGLLLILLLPTVGNAGRMANGAPVEAAFALTVISTLVLDLVFGIGAIAVCWGLRHGGWGLLAVAPLAMVWTPVLLSLRASPLAVLDGLLMRSDSNNWLPALLCITMWALPVGMLTAAVDLVRSYLREVGPSRNQP